MAENMKALIICDHIPYKDPRVMWHIGSLQERYHVDVLYLNRTNEYVAFDKLIANVRYFACRYGGPPGTSARKEGSPTQGSQQPEQPTESPEGFETYIPQQGSQQPEQPTESPEGFETYIPQRRFIPTVAQTAYAIRVSIANPFWRKLYDCLYKPSRIVYRTGRCTRRQIHEAKRHMTASLYESVGRSRDALKQRLMNEGLKQRLMHDALKQRLKQRISDYVGRKFLWTLVIIQDLVMLERTFKHLRNALSETCKKYDLIVASDLPVLRTGAHVKKIGGGILVYDAHENWSRVRPGTPDTYAMVMTRYERWSGAVANVVTTVSPLLVNHLEKSFPKKKVLLLPNAAPFGGIGSFGDASDFRVAKDKFASEMSKIAKSRLVAIFLGGVAPERGLRELVSAWEQISVEEAILVIRSPKGRNDELNVVISMAALNGTLGNTVFFLPSVTEEELIAAASAADVGIIPYKPTFDNHIMACPNKLSQYMQAGIAVVSNDIPFPRQIIRDANCGLIYSDRCGHREIVDSIMLLRRDGGKLKEYQRNAKSYCRTHYRWEIYYKCLLNVIDSTRTLSRVRGYDA